MYRSCFKRMIDCFLSVTGLIVCAIPMLIIALAIKIDSKGPVLFKQKRIGKNEQVFTIYKFRTMCVNAYEIGGIANSSNDSRITRVGAVLRRTSLDELPQMINIIKGDMAIIGPRPILPVEFKQYKNNKKYRHRHDVIPGLFCTVDIDLRASATREQQFDMDIDYIRNISFHSDLKYFCQIIKTVVSGKNVYREEEK